MYMDVYGCGWMWMDVDGCGWMWIDQPPPIAPSQVLVEVEVEVEHFPCSEATGSNGSSGRQREATGSSDRQI